MRAVKYQNCRTAITPLRRGVRAIDTPCGQRLWLYAIILPTSGKDCHETQGGGHVVWPAISKKTVQALALYCLHTVRQVRQTGVIHLRPYGLPYASTPCMTGQKHYGHILLTRPDGQFLRPVAPVVHPTQQAHHHTSGPLQCTFHIQVDRHGVPQAGKVCHLHRR